MNFLKTFYDYNNWYLLFSLVHVVQWILISRFQWNAKKMLLFLHEFYFKILPPFPARWILCDVIWGNKWRQIWCDHFGCRGKFFSSHTKYTIHSNKYQCKYALLILKIKKVFLLEKKMLSQSMFVGSYIGYATIQSLTYILCTLDCK